MEIRVISEGEVTAFRDALLTTFGHDLDADPGGDDRFRALIPLSQAWGVFDGGALVGTTATHNIAIGLPGGASLPIAGLTMVTIRPSHRRRGLLRRLIELHLADARARGLAVSGLWASEATIYGRFGYGIAAHHDIITIEGAASVEVAAGRETDAVEWVDEARARELLPAVYERATAQRPGALRRSDAWWRERRFVETPFMRAGASRRRHFVARRGDDIVGYIVFRQRTGTSSGLPGGKTEINELIALDPRAHASLWRFALAIDLFPTVSWWNAPVDDQLPWLVSDSRKIQRQRTDNLWLRIEDIPAALNARHYSADGTLRIAVEGATWEIVVEGGHGRCTPTTKAADIELARATLGSIYLGGTPVAVLASAGLVRGEAASLATANRMFESAIAPWCAEVF